MEIQFCRKIAKTEKATIMLTVAVLYASVVSSQFFQCLLHLTIFFEIQAKIFATLQFFQSPNCETKKTQNMQISHQLL